MEVSLNSPWKGASAWARVLEDGRLQLELYDYSPEAQQSMGNDVAWLYTVPALYKGRVRSLLWERAGLTVTDDQGTLEAIASQFPHVHAVRDWLRENGVPLDEKFDSWA
jgi:hypothetical protein